MIGGYYKVCEFKSDDGCTKGVFFQPSSKEEFSILIDDEYDSMARVAAGLFYSEPINDKVREIWLRERAIVLGDSVKVIKGKKIGVEGKVTRIYPIYNKYHNKVCDYVEIDNLYNTNVSNCCLA